MFLVFENLGAAFNYEWAAKKSLAEFKEHEKHHGFTDEQFKEIHDACVAKAKASALKKEEGKTK